ncbi:hypothetical protein PHYC_00180 [Phycisphaerales bacterium]|nr:hypothetical protein PHYC_00180 [Phycisphaerales bacterium]
MIWRPSILAALGLSLGSCAVNTPNDHLSPPPSETPGARLGSMAAPALINGLPIDEARLNQRLREIGGALALEEITLDAQLRRRFSSLQLALPPAAIQAERDLFIETLASESRTAPEHVAALLESLRSSRGLGPERFEALIVRSASLRLLVRDSVQVSPESLALAYQLESGPRCRIRLLTIPSAARAAEIRAALTPSAPPIDPAALPVLFAEQALLHSVDAQAAAGGLLPNVSPSDPSLAPAIRSAIAAMSPGTVSDVLGVEGGFALVLLESRSPGSELTPERRAEIDTRVQRRFERLAMNELANHLLAEANVVVLDRSLRWSWEHRPN